MRPQTFPELVRLAVADGVTFRLCGAQVRAENTQLTDPAVMDALRAEPAALWAYLSGPELDRPSLELLEHEGIDLTVPASEAEALELIARLEAEADACTGGLLGLDIETAANDGEEVRQPARIGHNGVSYRPPLDPLHLRRKHRPNSTAGLDPHRSSIRLAQLYAGGSFCMVLDTRLVPLAVLAPVLSRRKVVIHNAAFEIAFFSHAGVAIPRFECTMQAAGLIFGVRRRSLEDVAAEVLHLNVPKELQTSDWNAPKLSPGQLAYAALDAILALQLWRPLRDLLISHKRGGAYARQRDAIPVVVRMAARGIAINSATHQAALDQWSIALHTSREAFENATGAPPPTKPKELRALLEKVLPADVLTAWPRTAKTGELTTAGRELKRQTGIPAIQPLRDMLKQEKLLSTFGAILAARIAKDGRLHASFNVAGTKTGRMGCSSPNMQQMPKDASFRRCFVAAPGCVLIVGDYATMELRAVAEIAGDPVMRQDFADGADLHRRLAAEMTGLPEDQITDAQKNAAKPINFGTIYGAGGKGLAASAWASYDVKLTPEEAEAARDRFLGRYRHLAVWMRSHADTCQRQGFISIGRLGRVIRAEWEKAPPPRPSKPWLGGDEDDDDPWPEELTEEDVWISPRSSLKYTLCCNAPVQGACADIALLAMIEIDRALREAGIGGGLVLAVHDEFILEVSKEHAAEAAELLEACMVRAFCDTFPDAPLTKLVKIETAPSWGEAKAR
jgi:DNA polymerase I-like protein with 3'-5' exonuclease and polymerase domains